jgi:hypothetical protein
VPEVFGWSGDKIILVVDFGAPAFGNLAER